MNCRTCKDWRCRCDSCVSLVEMINGKWYCDELQIPCEDVECCDEYDCHSGCDNRFEYLEDELDDCGVIRDWIEFYEHEKGVIE